MGSCETVREESLLTQIQTLFTLAELEPNTSPDPAPETGSGHMRARNVLYYLSTNKHKGPLIIIVSFDGWDVPLK